MAIERSVTVRVNLEGRGSLSQTIQDARGQARQFQQEMGKRLGSPFPTTQTGRPTVARAGTPTEGGFTSRLGEEADRARGVFGRLAESIERVGRGATIAFAAGSAAIAGFVRQASPDAWETFTGSLQLLSGEIGMGFIPALVRASQWLQNASRWVRGLDDDTKDNIATWGVWAVGIAGGITVLSRVIAIGRDVAGAFSAIGGAVRAAALGLAGLIVANPLLAGLAAITAAVGVLGAAFLLTGERATDAITRAQTSIQRLASTAATLADFAKLPAELRERLALAQERGDTAGIRQIVEGELARRGPEIEAARPVAARSEREAATFERALPDIGNLLDVFIPGGSQLFSTLRGRGAETFRAPQTQLAEERERFAILQNIRQRGLTELSGATGAAGREGPGGSTLLRARAQQPQLLSQEQYFSRLILQGAQSDLQQALVDQQMRGNERLDELNGQVKGLRDDIAQFRPRPGQG